MFPNSIFDEYVKDFTPEERIEVLLYVLVKNITFSNYSEVVEKLHLIIDQNDYLLASLKKIVSSRFYVMSSKVYKMLSDEFGLNLQIAIDNLHKIFYDDDRDAFIEFLNSKHQDGYTPENFKQYVKLVVWYDSVKILRFMISAGITVEALKDDALKAITVGNFEIIRLFEQCGIDYSKVINKSSLINIGNYCVSEWLLLNYHTDLIKSYSPMYYKSHVLDTRELHSLGLWYDLPNLYFKTIEDYNQIGRELNNILRYESHSILRECRRRNININL